MKPTLVLVGRPNVGKSTLFNRLTATRDALVADAPGLTRDRHYGLGRMGNHPFIVVDTGGLEPNAKDGVFAQMARQTQAALAEADVILFIVDARTGITPQDRQIAESIRKLSRSVFLVANKAESAGAQLNASEFNELGLGLPWSISAAHGEGVRELIAQALENYPAEEEDASAEEVSHPKVAIVGRPNVGKSTLLNALLGENRVVVFDLPGTTRDAIEVDCTIGKRTYTLIDTAGMRRRGKVFESVEKFSVIKTLQAIDAANVVILMLDAKQDISDQDAHIAGFVLERGKALVLAINKWDGLDQRAREEVRHAVTRKLKFVDYARQHYISAARAQGLKALFDSVAKAYSAAHAKLATPRLTRVLQSAIEQQAPPRKGLVRPKMRYAHQGGSNPPLIIIHGNTLDSVPDSYRRYLESKFREAFRLEGTPLRIEFRGGQNPFADR